MEIKFLINQKLKSFFLQEKKLKRVSGTYLFYGENSEFNFEVAKIFSKVLNCSDEYYCDNCEVCLRIDKETYGDLIVCGIDGVIQISQIRELIQNDMRSSYEGRKKIYILKDIHKMRREALNALLKLIEEPNKDSFFILLSTTLNILPTIKSRSIIFKIDSLFEDDYGISSEEYLFFNRNYKDIMRYRESDIDIKEMYSYQNIGDSLKKYLEYDTFEAKVDVYRAIRDFINLRSYLTDIDKIFFAEEIVNSGASREHIKWIISYIITFLEKDFKNLEDYLEIKKMMNSNINLKNLLIVFFNKL